MVLLRNEKDYLAADNEKKQQLIKSLHQELGEVDAELDDDEDDPLIHCIRREFERRVKDCEDSPKLKSKGKQCYSIRPARISRMHGERPTMLREVPLPYSTSRSAMS